MHVKKKLSVFLVPPESYATATRRAFCDDRIDIEVASLEVDSKFDRINSIQIDIKFASVLVEPETA